MRCKQLLDESAVERTLMRMAHQIIERNPDAAELRIVGIQSRGAVLAERIAENIRRISDQLVLVGSLDPTRCRDDLVNSDDLDTLPAAELPFSVQNKIVILVDDVLFTGRTVRAAIEALFCLGRPSCIQLAVLVDRGHRELPLRGDFVGKNIPTSRSEHIQVLVPEYDSRTAVELVQQD